MVKKNKKKTYLKFGKLKISSYLCETNNKLINKIKINSMRQFKHIMSFIICSKWADERDFADSRDVDIIV